ncbi:hypothetical protein CJF31_00008860 [Rutstroemia sp. NJR-2017a BVV2]|nr:hypothetical protein CJF31_00008860 [Rutstroemia sp. NJR-2017a BVV2]
MTGFMSVHLAKCLRFTLGRFTNRWASEEELNKPKLLKEHKFPQDLPAQWSVLRWQYTSPLLQEMKNRELATRMRAQSQELRVEAAVEVELERRVMSLDRDFVWLGAV